MTELKLFLSGNNGKASFVIEEDDYDLSFPAYSEKGFMVVEIVEGLNDSPWNKWDYKEVRIKGGGEWIQEGIGVDYFINQYLDEDIKEPGWYLIKGLYGKYVEGDGWDTDDEEYEEWYWDKVVKITEEEGRKLL